MERLYALQREWLRRYLYVDYRVLFQSKWLLFCCRHRSQAQNHVSRNLEGCCRSRKFQKDHLDYWWKFSCFGYSWRQWCLCFHGECWRVAGAVQQLDFRPLESVDAVSISGLSRKLKSTEIMGLLWIWILKQQDRIILSEKIVDISSCLVLSRKISRLLPYSLSAVSLEIRFVHGGQKWGLVNQGR